MATNLLSWPFRIAPNGSAVTRPQDSVEYHAEEISQMVTTRQGERPLVPSFGLEDTTYNQIDPQELAIRVGQHKIPVRILDVVTKQVTEGRQEAVVTFVPLDSGSDAFRVNVNALES